MFITKQLTFLGANWTATGVERLPSLQENLRQAINAISPNLKKKESQRIRGYLIYYLSFAGPVHSIVSRALLEPKVGKTYLYQLLEVNKIKFKDPPTGNPLNVFSDATPSRLGWIHSFGEGTAPLKNELPIMFTETLAAIIAIYSAVNAGARNIVLHTDNMATRAFLRRGTSKFLYQFSYQLHFSLIFLYCKLRYLANWTAVYINTSVNPADRLTRLC